MTLIELVVVLVLMGLAVGLVAPSLLPPPEAAADLNAAIELARNLAVRRGEPLTLQVAAGGAWRIDGALPETAPIASGHVQPILAPLTLHVSPLGTCGPEPGTSATVHVDPFTCTLVP